MNPSNSDSLLLLVGPILLRTVDLKWGELKKTETLEKHLLNENRYKAGFPTAYHNFGRAQL